MTQRRVKGEGSVYQRKNGRFVGEYDDANGKRRYITGKNKADVRAKLREKLAKRDKGIVVDSEGLTVEKYLGRWLDEICDTVRPSSFRSYEAIARVHLKPTVGKTKLEKLTSLQLQTLYREILSGAEMSQCGMPSAGVVEALDVLEDRSLGALAVRP